ncbi:MAG TPA: TetR/AcrR family transcriptional regulator C-terminal domain-containing protein, partial [Anaeromyxobacter sp.]|nr:TetR/AcrR family transcriptional regulator C-terminal domain-containing protein [Anaeromyxobacter sp.]
VKSRRGGPAKAPLSREVIVAAALDLLRREGLEGMSLRQVAAALDTGAATLYAYVDDLLELQTLVLDRALAGVETGGRPGAPWKARLRDVLVSYFHVLAQSPGLATLAMRTVAAGPNTLRVLEALLSLLEEAGVDPGTAAWAVDLLLLWITGSAVEQSLRQGGRDPLGFVAQVIATVGSERFPRIHAARDELISGSGFERFAWGLDVFLSGILQSPRTPARPPRAGRRGARPAR